MRTTAKVTAVGAALGPFAVVALLAPRAPDAFARLQSATEPYGPRFDALVGDVALLAALALTGWVGLLGIVALACRVTGYGAPRMLLTLTPTMWRPAVAALAGGALALAGSASAGAVETGGSPTASGGGSSASAHGAAPSTAMLEGLALPDRPDRLGSPQDVRRSLTPRSATPRSVTPRSASPRSASARSPHPRTKATAPVAPTAAKPTTTSPRRSTYRVRTGESLWTIAADRLADEGVTVTSRRINREWRGWYALNRGRIGADPDALRVRLVLRVPGARAAPAKSTTTRAAPPTPREPAPRTSAPRTSAPRTSAPSKSAPSDTLTPSDKELP